MINTTNKTKLLGLIGTPVEHTISPEMHSIMSNRYGFDFSYLAFDIKKEDLQNVISAAKAMGVRGFNVTAPHKIDVMNYIDEIDSDALLMGTVNTIVNTDGKLKGYNTDGDGFVNSLEFENTEVKGKKVLMLGAGGSARSIAYKLAKKKVSRLDISSRSKEKIKAIADIIEKNTDVKVDDEINKTVEYDIIINTTPLGMYPHTDENPFPCPEMFNSTMTACDIIYNPKKTLFLKEAQKYGARVVNGLSMLVLQGVYAFEYFADEKIDDKLNLYFDLMKNFGDFNISTKG